MRPRLFFLITIAILMFAGGCARRPLPKEGIQPLPEKDIIALLQKRSTHWKTYQAKLDVKAVSQRGKTKFRCIVLADLPDSFRLEAYSTWGQTMGVLILVKSASFLWVPSKKTVYTAARAQDLIRHFLGISIPMDVFGYSLIASAPVDLLASAKFSSSVDGLIAKGKDPIRYWKYKWTFDPYRPAMRSFLVQQRLWNFSVEYDPMAVLNVDENPSKIRYSSADWHMEVKVLRMESLPNLRKDVFQPTFPDNIRRVILNGQK